MKFKIKFISLLIVICSASEIKGLTGLEIYAHLNQSKNKEIQNIRKNDICSCSANFFYNELFEIDKKFNNGNGIKTITSISIKANLSLNMIYNYKKKLDDSFNNLRI